MSVKENATWIQRVITLTSKPRGCHLITTELQQALPEIKRFSIGLLNIFLQHTSASITINENYDPNVRKDMEMMLNNIAPEEISYKHSCEGADDMPAHVKCALLGSSLNIPITDGKLNLGQWQGIWLCEHRNYGGSRRIVATVQDMSKFFRGFSDSESESESTEDEVQISSRPSHARPVQSLPFSDSDDDERRVVRPEKDRRFEELNELIRQIKNYRKISDMSKLLGGFEDLCKAFQKARALIDREGGGTPRFFLRCLAELEQFVNEKWEDREGRRQMSKNNARGLTTLRQKLRKYMREFDLELADYKEAPDMSDRSSDATAGELSSDADDEVDMDKRESAARRVKKAVAKSDAEDEESDWEMSSSTDSELEDLTGKKMEELRRFFLKSTTRDDDERARKKLERKKRREDKEKPGEAKVEEEEGEWQQTIGSAAVVVEAPKMFEKESDINAEAVAKKLQELISVRKRKATDRFAPVDLLKELLKITTSRGLNPALQVKINFAIITSYFDCNPKMADALLHSSWLSCMACLQDLTDILMANQDIICGLEVNEDMENLTDPTLPYQIHACLVSVFERLDDEFTKILQDADCHSTDYVEKLKGEKIVCSYLDSLIQYMRVKLAKKQCPVEEVCRIYMRKIHHLYYKFDPEALACESKDSVVNACASSSLAEMKELCQYLYVNDTTKRLRTEASLCQVYHLALHDHWYQARDILLMSHLQTHIDHTEISSQILYNRAVCQLGLCAFRNGLIREALYALSDLQNGGRAKELLAQGSMMRNQDRTPEQEKLERLRRMPYHMHINLELAECVYLLCAMLLEIPLMASKEFEFRRSIVTRSFHYQLKQSERQYIVGPPENTREHVMAASKALLTGDWKACVDYVFNPKMNAKVWNLFPNSEKVKGMIVARIKLESLKAYIISFSSVYDSVSLQRLASMFDLDLKTVHTAISKLIIENNFPASFDEPSGCVVISHTEPKRLHTLALQLTDKLNGLAENVEQLLDPRTGGSRAYGKWIPRYYNISSQ
ncbi:Eukaryotic translation initiation factor 3 subunit C [Trichinella pseudospiralis]|uniref:Eukaryotic translation initiation factor 3 subunit C n=2 Tax=Trichinella pseudospiralis TaxID=6337 RepID=A0A0V1G4I3_TRIPS|nr:Eukaryotic translation initiation factor 3 subunit C [Trichinella pseudospiralis]